MAANIVPIFPKSPLLGVANISTANANRTVTGVTGLTLVVASSTEGARLDRVRVQATVATTVGFIRLWLYNGAGDAQLIREVPITAATPSASVAAFSVDVDFDRETIPGGWSLYASTHNAEAFNVCAFGGAY